MRLLPLVALGVLLASSARAGDWEPGPGDRTEATRTRPDFSGMGFLFPLRLHLVRGGHIDGQVAGVDAGLGELLLVTGPGQEVRIDYLLLDALTPLAALPAADSPLAGRTPPGLASAAVVSRLRPTWRSGLGLTLNLLAPGTGHFIQTDEKSLGFLFLGMDVFFLAAGSLAAFAPSRLSAQERVFFGGAFFAFDLLTRGIGAAHAFGLGRERIQVLAPEPAPGLAR